MKKLLAHFHYNLLAIACMLALPFVPVEARSAGHEHESRNSKRSSWQLSEQQEKALHIVQGKNGSAGTGNNLWTVSASIDLSDSAYGLKALGEVFYDRKNTADDLISFFREKYHSENAGSSDAMGRYSFSSKDAEGSFVLEHSPFAGDADKVGKPFQPAGDTNRYNGVFYFHGGEDNTPWEVRYNFRDDGLTEQGAPVGTDTTVLSFYNSGHMDNVNFNSLKFFVFDLPVSTYSQNHLVSVGYTDNSRSDIGLSLSNSRRNLTFTGPVNLVSTFNFYSGESGKSRVGNTLIASGIYNSVGAQIYTPDLSSNVRLQDLIFEPGSDKTELSAYAKALGSMVFKDFATVSITHAAPRTDLYTGAGAGQDKPDTEVFGVYNNAGGSTVFEQGADILVSGRQSDTLISALTSASSLGVLDPLKQGSISVQASSEQKVSRIWGFAQDDDKVIDPYSAANKDAYTLQSQDLQAYTSALQRADVSLRTAAFAAHGSEISLSDRKDGGWLDIRGDLVAGTRNRQNTAGGIGMSYSNTFEHHAGAVVRAQIDVSLENASSVLYGNVYERHRVGLSEVIHGNLLGENQSFESWRKSQLAKEKAVQGGKVNLSLAGGAVWYPQQLWFGWNNDLFYQDFRQAFGSDGMLAGGIPDIIDYSQALPYSRLDFSDQYNLQVKGADGKYHLMNHQYKDDAGKVLSYADTDPDRVNDGSSAVVSGAHSYNGISYAYEKAGQYTTVDNGIYRLSLAGGQVDTRYLRQDFSFASVDLVRQGITKADFDGKGVKKLRIQELNLLGDSMFNLYVKDSTNHDLLILDEVKQASDGSALLQFGVWNKDFDPAVIKNGDPSSFIHIARVAKGTSFDPNIYAGIKTGSIYRTYYYVMRDEALHGINKEESFTWQQGLDWHQGMDNLFIVGEGATLLPDLSTDRPLPEHIAPAPQKPQETPAEPDSGTGSEGGEAEKPQVPEPEPQPQPPVTEPEPAPEQPVEPPAEPNPPQEDSDPDTPQEPVEPPAPPANGGSEDGADSDSDVPAEDNAGSQEQPEQSDKPVPEPVQPEVAPEIVSGLKNIAALTYGFAVIDNDSLHRRRTESRYLTGQDEGPWLRYRYIRSGLSGNEDQAEIIQAGFDTAIHTDTGSHVFTVAADYLQGKSDLKDSSGGDNEVKRFGLGLYYTWLHDSGLYVDVSGRAGWYRASVDSQFLLPNGLYHVDGDFSFMAGSLGAETGYKIAGQDGWFIEPQAQLTWTVTEGFGFTTSEQVDVSADSMHSLIGRAGFRTGRDLMLSGEDRLSVYVSADVLREFAGEQRMTVRGRADGRSADIMFDGSKTWYRAGAGLSYDFSKTGSVFVSYDRSFGADIHKTWEVSAGLSFVF